MCISDWSSDVCSSDLLLVQPSGSRLWRMKYRFDGKEKLLSFGKYPLITLAIARAKRDDAKLLLDQGKDPAEVKKQQKRQRAALKQFEEIARADRKSVA